MISLDELIIGCKKHQRFAQKMLYEQYAPLMRGVCLRYVKNFDTANDIVQEGFIKVFSKINSYNDSGSFVGWMKRIFINTSISFLRKKSRYKEVFQTEDLETIDIEEQDFNSTGNYNKTITREEILQEPIDFNIIVSADFSEIELLDILNRLPDKYRLVFNLYSIEKLKHEEIAKLLNIETATSRSRLLRARSLIKKELRTLCLEKLKI